MSERLIMKKLSGSGYRKKVQEKAKQNQKSACMINTWLNKSENEKNFDGK